MYDHDYYATLDQATLLITTTAKAAPGLRLSRLALALPLA